MKRPIHALALAAVMAAAVPAAAQTDQAKTLFNVGAQAYEAGHYAAAIQAFEQAYKLAKRSGILFSIAQAHRKHYYATKSPDELRAAIKGYRDYLGQVGSGGRRSDAGAALVELEPLAGKIDMNATVSAQPVATRLMVSSQTAGAQIALDGGKPLEVPLIAEVKPGKHSIKLSAPGYFEEARDIEVAPGSVAALDIPLRDKPGHVTIEASSSAQVSLDGRFVGATPLSQPLNVEPGRHLLVVTKNGHRAYSYELDVGRDEQKKISVKLERSGQRVASYVLMGLGGGAAIAGGVVAALAARQQRIASDFDNQRQTKTVRCDDIGADPICAGLTSYDSAIAKRDELRRYAGITLAAAALVGGTGIVLFAFDQPNLSALPSRSDDGKKATPAPVRERPLEMSAVPVVSPGFYGASLTGRF